MLNRKKMSKLTEENEGKVFQKVSDIYKVIKLHSLLGYSEVDMYVSKKIAAKAHSALDGMGYYCNSYEFECLPNESRLYIAWHSGRYLR